jgi:transposase-like protein
MTKQSRRKFTPEFKAKVALEAAKDQLTLAHLSQKFEVNAVMSFFRVFSEPVRYFFQCKRNGE